MDEIHASHFRRCAHKCKEERKAASDDDEEIELCQPPITKGPLAGGRTRRARRHGGVDSCDLFISCFVRSRQRVTE
jgi:hypothetical protein